MDEKKQNKTGRERLHKEVASPFGFVVSQYDCDCRKINTFGGLQNGKRNLQRGEWSLV